MDVAQRGSGGDAANDGRPPRRRAAGAGDRIKGEQAAGGRLSPENHEFVAQIVHYTIGIAPAIGYALYRDKLPGTGAARGALYGLGLFLGEDELLNPIAGLSAKPRDYPWQAHARELLAHTVYRIATEFAINAAQDALRPRIRSAHATAPA